MAPKNMTPPSDTRPPMVIAIEWVARITAVGLEMFLPGLAGQWLDAKLGTRFYLTLFGFGIGFVGGMWHLLVMTGAVSNKRNRSKSLQRKASNRNDDLDEQ